MKPGYINMLSKEERAGCMKMGAVMAFARFGVTPDKADAVIKKAGLNDYINTAGKAVIAMSLIGGIPLGVAAHIINRRINEQSAKERELEEKLKYYRAASSSLGQGLATLDK